MNYIVLDLEATCWESKNKADQNEIIEIGALKINEDGNIIGEFCEFIKPILNPQLSDFCKNLTTITQADIDTADTYNIVIKRFKKWINQAEPFVLCSWGFYDRRQFEKDCKLHKLDKTWLSNHISLKHQYAELTNLRKPIGMNEALRREGFKLEGTHHRGIDDARNIEKIFDAYFDYWVI
ncbi:MAG: exonuclease domain-containing protein [Aureispira sp.]|nr:exonuclease domain-containing protein [Aureispira sp.]